MGVDGRTACAVRNTTSELSGIELCKLLRLILLGVYPYSLFAVQSEVMLTMTICFATHATYRSFGCAPATLQSGPWHAIQGWLSSWTAVLACSTGSDMSCLKDMPEGLKGCCIAPR